MIFYLINIFLIVITWYLPVNIINETDNQKSIDVRSKRVCIVGAINWIVLSGFRSLTVGADTKVYALSFENALTSSWESLWKNIFLAYFLRTDIQGKDFGFSILEKIVRQFTSSYTVWLILIAILFTIPMAVYIYRYSSNACLSWIVYSTLFYSFFSITGHRQAIATAIGLWGGLELIRKRKFVPFIVLVLIASTIHKSALCLIPFYWVSQIRITKPKLFLYIIGIICSFLFRNQLMIILQSIVGYEGYMQHEAAQAGIFMFLLLAIALCIFVFWEKFEYSENPLLDMSVNAVMVACIFSSLLLINPSCMRVVQYFSIFLLFLLPEFECIFAENSKKLFLRIIGIVMIFLLIRQMPFYSFVFM